MDSASNTQAVVSPNPRTNSASSIHSFFTPRRRPLKSVAPNSNSWTKNQLATDDSPSAKRQRTSAYCGSTKSLMREEEDQEDQPEAQITNPPRARNVCPNQALRFLWREIGALNPSRGAHRGKFHCTHWSTELLKFYSRPQDILVVLGEQGQPSLPFSVQALSQNPLVAIGDETGVVRLVESAKDEKPGFDVGFVTMPGHDNAIFDISLTPDDSFMATACGDQKIRILDVKTQTITRVLEGHISSVKQAAFSPDNPNILGSCARDGCIMIWDIRFNGMKNSDTGITGHRPTKILRRAHAPLTTGRGPRFRPDVSVTALTWTNPETFSTASESHAEVRSWDMRALKTSRKGNPVPSAVSPEPKHHTRPFGLNSLSISPDRTMLYSLCRDSIVYAWSPRHLDSGPIRAFTHPQLHASTFYVKTSVSRDGQYLAAGSSDGVACVFPTADTYFDRKRYEQPGFAEGSRAAAVAKEIEVGTGVALVRGHHKEVTDVSWTCGGDLVAISDDCYARCWRSDGKGEEAEDMRDGGEEGGRRWGWGWAEMEQSEADKEQSVDGDPMDVEEDDLE